MKVLLIVFICLIGASSVCQTILHPSGKRNKIVEVKPNQTYHYYDDAGPHAKYTIGTSSILTIYPSKKGQYVSLACNSFAINSDCRMYIFDGNHAGAPILAYVDIHTDKKSTHIKKGDVFTASSANKSGALSIRFTNVNHRATMEGWDFTVSCKSTAGSPPRKTTQDCSGAIKVCSNKQITTKSIGCNFQELPGPHFWNKILNYGGDGENQSNWYKFEVATAGTIEFLIKPHTHTDFDWVLFGPYAANECPAWTIDKPYRTSAGDGKNSRTGITGLASSASDFHEGSEGDGFVAPINVKKGEHYVLMIDDWSGNNTTFDLQWNFLNGASLECKKDKDPPIIPDVDDVVIEIETVEVVEIVDTTVVEIIETIELPDTIQIDIIESKCNDPIVIIGKTTPETLTQKGAIDLKLEGGKSPYSYKWIDPNGKQLSTQPSLFGLVGGTYQLEVTDAEQCVEKKSFLVEVEEEFKVVEEGPKLEADLSLDQKFITVSYPGAFEYKIENLNSETVITGHSVDSDEVEITKLPPGTYRVSLIYKKIKQYVIFVKD